MKPDAAWRRWLDFALTLVGLDELAVFAKRPAAAVPAVWLEEQAAARPEQANLAPPPPAPPALPARVRPAGGAPGGARPRAASSGLPSSAPP